MNFFVYLESVIPLPEESLGPGEPIPLEFADLKRIGVVLKRALYFITCNGRMMYNTRLEESYITRNLLDEENCRKHGNEAAFQQLSLFGDEMGSRRLYTENTKNHVDRKVGAI